MTNLNQPTTARWRIWSSTESVRNREPSVMAIVETCFAPILYLWLASLVGWLLPLYVAAVVAPFVLLRSDESVALGVKWALVIEEHDKPAKPLSPWSIVLGVVALLGYWLVAFKLWGPPFFENNTIQSGAALGAVLVLPVIFIVPAIVLLVAVSIRITATAVFWREGLRSLPENFRILILCVSPSQVPELVPGLDGTTSWLTFSGFRKMISGIDMSISDNGLTAATEWYVRVLSKLAGMDLKRRRGHVSRLIAFQPTLIKWINRAIKDVLYTLFALFIFTPAWAYRITIKSTIWFWWPLAFIGGGLRFARKLDLLRWNLIGSLWAKTSILVACLSLMTFLWTNAFLDASILDKNPLIAPIGYFLVLDWKLQLWQICAFAAAVMSIILVFWMNDLSGRLRIASETADTELHSKGTIELGWMERFARLRFLFVLSFWILVAAHALLYLNSQTCSVQLPDKLQKLAQKIYGNRTPPSTCVQPTAEPNQPASN